MLTAIRLDSSIEYPFSSDFFSPSERYPEFKDAPLAQERNSVYSAVRKCLLDAGLDRDNAGTKDWNPFKQYIQPGNKVFVLCNFVQEKVGFGGPDFGFAKCTHASVIRPVIDYILIALKGKGSIRFGNAPLQAANWEKVTEETGATRLQEFYREFHPEVPVELTDLRQQIIRRSMIGAKETDLFVESNGSWVEINLGRDSLLEPLYSNGTPKFRVLDYDHRRTERCHSSGQHTYLMSKHIIESDVVISIPKLKTHEKVGITCGIKGCVGTIAHKDCLAHHRLGPPSEGGDEYPNDLPFLKASSLLHDRVNTRPPGPITSAMFFVDVYSRKVIRLFTRALGGSWPGNDTCWRMALDLARIVQYADKSGNLRDEAQRCHLMITDGVVAGEGDGPLSPTPVFLGYLSFSDNVLVGDYINCVAMKFHPESIPMIQEGLNLKKLGFVDTDFHATRVLINGQAVPLVKVGDHFTRRFRPAREWCAKL